MLRLRTHGTLASLSLYDFTTWWSDSGITLPLPTFIRNVRYKKTAGPACIMIYVIQVSKDGISPLPATEDNCTYFASTVRFLNDETILTLAKKGYIKYMILYSNCVRAFALLWTYLLSQPPNFNIFYLSRFLLHNVC